MATTAARRPVGADDRIHALDVLRGFALLGMIVVHFHTNVNTDATGAEGLIGWIVWVGIETKSWGTFAFLFGVGFAVLLRRLQAKGIPFVTFYLRRLLVLAFFGVLAEALFGFHVLLDYAIWGLPLLVLHRLSTGALLVLAVIAAAANPVWAAGAALQWWPPLLDPSTVEARRNAQLAIESAQAGASFLTLLAARLTWMRLKYLAPAAVVPNVTLTLFVLGLLAVRTGLIDEPRRHSRTIAGWMGFGFAAWLVSWLVLFQIPELSVRDLTWPVRSGFGIVHEQWLCFTFIGAVLLLLAHRTSWRRRFTWVGSAGRMALTNYMLQAAVLDVLVSGYGLSVKLRPALGMVSAGLLFGIEMAFSRWWLQRYLFGPCEWVWRSLTYGVRQPIRRAREVSGPAQVL